MDDNSKNSINNENKDDNDLSIEFFSEKEKIEKDGVAATEILEDGKVSDSSEGFCESIEFFDPEEEIYGEKVFEHTEFSEKNDINFEEESELGEENTEDVFSDSEKVSEDEENAPEEEKSRKKRNIIVIVCVIIAAILLLKYYKDFNSFLPFLITGFVALFVGFILNNYGKKHSTFDSLNDIKRSEALMIVSLSWLTFGLIAAIHNIFAVKYRLRLLYGVGSQIQPGSAGVYELRRKFSKRSTDAAVLKHISGISCLIKGRKGHDIFHNNRSFAVTLHILVFCM